MTKRSVLINERVEHAGFELGPGDWTRAIRRRTSPALGFTIFMATLVALSMWHEYQAEIEVWVPFTVLPGIAAAFWLRPVAVAHQHLRRHGDGGSMEVGMVATEGYLLIEDGDRSRRLSWESIFGYEEYRGELILLLGDDDILPVPLARIQPSMITLLRDRLTRNPTLYGLRAPSAPLKEQRFFAKLVYGALALALATAAGLAVTNGDRSPDGAQGKRECPAEQQLDLEIAGRDELTPNCVRQPN